MSDLRYVNLRGDAGNSIFVNAVATVLKQELPVDSNTMTTGEHRICWLGPDEWLIVTSREAFTVLLARLRETLAGQHSAITDVSGGNVLLRLRGEKASDVLAKGCTLDFHSDVFPVGRCAQSGLAKANVLIGHVDAEPVYEIIVRRSFSEYLSLWLQSACAEYGTKVSVTHG